MKYVLSEQQQYLQRITLNRVDKHNAFNDQLLTELLQSIREANNNQNVRVILLAANGAYFSAGADLTWMQRMAKLSEAENLADATDFAQLMLELYNSSKPTIAMVQGSAFGGGAGLIAACDIVIAAESAQFCFSEVSLGLIPAVISPYVIKAIGERTAAALFMSAERFDAKRAHALQLVHHCVPDHELQAFSHQYATHLAHQAPQAVAESKLLARQIAAQPINAKLPAITAALIAKKRVSAEGQKGIHAFLNKQKPQWD